jgi:hypothetical protein
MITKTDVFIQEEYDRWKAISEKKPEFAMDEERLQRMSIKHEVPNLAPKVIEWLNENVLDSSSDKKQPQGWAIGNEDYRANSHNSITLWFIRRGDAMKFIKEWSVHKKPTTFLNYFKDDYRELHEGKLKVFDRSTKQFTK